MTTGSDTSTRGQDKQFKHVAGCMLELAKHVAIPGKENMGRFLQNGGKFQKEALALFVKHSIADSRFEFLNFFVLTPPRCYHHASQLTTFVEYAKSETGKFFFCNHDINDQNFTMTTHELVPSRPYGVMTFGVRAGATVSGDDCLAFYESQQAMFVGPQGLTLVQQLKKTEFPVGKWTVSFDKKEALWQDANGFHTLPGICPQPEGDWAAHLWNYESDLDHSHCLMLFHDLSTLNHVHF